MSAACRFVGRLYVHGDACRCDDEAELLMDQERMDEDAAQEASQTA